MCIKAVACGEKFPLPDLPLPPHHLSDAFVRSHFKQIWSGYTWSSGGHSSTMKDFTGLFHRTL